MRAGPLPGTPILVDCFSAPAVYGLRFACYFLTHWHADHYEGLSAGFGHGPLYCSEITARLAALDGKLPALSVRVLPLGSVERVDVGRGDGRFECAVTALDANHCPGSCAFLFELADKVYLHLGDFRLYPDFWQLPQVRAVVSGARPLDLLVVDPTFARVATDFPSKEASTRRLVRYLRVLVEAARRIDLCFDMLGTEELLEAALLTIPPEWGPVGVQCHRRLQQLRITLPEHHFGRLRYAGAERDAYRVLVVKRGLHRRGAVRVTCSTMWHTLQRSVSERSWPTASHLRLLHSMHSNGRELQLLKNRLRPLRVLENQATFGSAVSPSRQPTPAITTARSPLKRAARALPSESGMSLLSLLAREQSPPAVHPPAECVAAKRYGRTTARGLVYRIDLTQLDEDSA